SIIWNLDGSGFFYKKLDEHHLPTKLYFHRLGIQSAQDQLIFHEPNPEYGMGAGRSSDRQYLLISSGNSESSETRIINLKQDYQQQQVVFARQDKILYGVDIAGKYIYTSINDTGPNFRLIRTDLTSFTSTKRDQWLEVIAHHDERYLVGFSLQQQYLSFTLRISGLNKLFVTEIDNLPKVQQIPFDDASYTAGCSFPTYDLPLLRVGYSSFRMPATVYEFNPATSELIHRKTAEIPSGHNPKDYVVERLYAPTDDGVAVPISLFYNKNKVNPSQAPAPLLLYGYGSYGINIPARFSKSVLSLVDRGAIYAVAHIRGGDDLGYEWYNQTRFLGKKKTFNDFITATKYLIEQKYTSPKQIVIQGGSAGGMLMGAVANAAPELYKGVVAMVPFVDVLSTMLDHMLPLTPGEYTEWGNPAASDELYNYIASYSPYDNVKQQAYPEILVTAGLTDPRVTYWEAAKWVAKLRDYNTGNSKILLKMEMGAGHFGPTGIDNELEELAEIYA
ncbi:MAG: prolyl oligopeptidase family serine peptidase, partial [Pseudomonadota bacterium]